jgi:uncharacterized cupin superfamily protein
MQKSPVIRIDPGVPMEVWPDFPESEVCSGSRASVGHRWLNEPQAGLSVGVWEAPANLGRWMHWPVHEFMLIVEGEVVMVEEDRETVIGAGEAFFIPKGRRCIWNQAGHAKKIFVIFDDTSGAKADGARPIVKFDPDVALTSSPPPSAALLTSPVPRTRSHLVFEDATGQFSVGVWEASAYERKLTGFAHTELMHVLDGTISLTDANGFEQSFGPGETLLVPANTPNRWKTTGTVKKIFCTFSPQAAK